MEREEERETKGATKTNSEALIQPRVISCGVKSHLDSKQFQTHEFHEIFTLRPIHKRIINPSSRNFTFPVFFLSGNFHENHMAFWIFSVNFYGGFREIHEIHEFQCEIQWGFHQIS